MKWFQHYTDATNDEFIAYAFEKYGLEFYGFYWRLVEIVANQVKQNSDVCSVKYTKKKWLIDTHAARKKFDFYLNLLENEQKIEVVNNEDRITITMPSVLKIRDTYSQRKKTESEPEPKLPPPERKENPITVELNRKINDVFAYYLLKTGNKHKLSEERKSVIRKRLKENYTVEQMNAAIDAFTSDDWEDRKKYSDVVYIFGTIKKVNKLDFWLSKGTQKTFTEKEKAELEI